MGDCNREKNFVSAVIYIHNCEKRIEIFLQTIMEVLEENFEHSEIICVNDSSNYLFYRTGISGGDCYDNADAVLIC